MLSLGLQTLFIFTKMSTVKVFQLLILALLGYCPHSKSWIIFIVELYIAINVTPTMDFYGVGAGPKVLPFLSDLL